MDSMNTQQVWGLDIGGTKCALVIGDRTGRVLYKKQVQTNDYQGNWQKLLDELLSGPSAAYPRPVALGISCGGPLDSKRGLILSPPNLPGWDHVPIVDYVQGKLQVPCYLQNDANACALAEWMYGAGRGTRNMVFFTFGTGLGAGLILDGKLYTGTNDMAGEAGHIRLSITGPMGYGKKGSFEGFCSGGGLQKLSQEMLGEELSAKELVKRADTGDPNALRVLKKSARQLGKGLAILVDLLNPECIVIGSVYERAERYFKREMERTLQKEALPLSLSCCRVVPARLGDTIGDIAALTVAWNGWKGETP